VDLVAVCVFFTHMYPIYSNNSEVGRLVASSDAILNLDTSDNIQQFYSRHHEFATEYLCLCWPRVS